jgi:hypothetical protein
VNAGQALRQKLRDACLRRQQVVQPPVEVRVLKAVLSHEDEEAVQREHAIEASPVDRVRQEVGEQNGVPEVGQHGGCERLENASVDSVRQRDAQEAGPCVAARALLLSLLLS